MNSVHHRLLISVLLASFMCLLLISPVSAVTWDWEDGTLQGWTARDNFSAAGDTLGLTNTTILAYHGEHSLSWHINGTTNDKYWYLSVDGSAIKPGETVFYHVWVPPNAPINGYKTFLKDANGNWVDGTWFGYGGLVKGGWNKLQIAVPSQGAFPLLELGLQLVATTETVNITSYLDYVIAGLPAAPTGLSAYSPALSQVQLDWEDNPESNIHYYNIYRSQSLPLKAILENLVGISETSDYLDVGLLPHTKYHYGITAVDSEGDESPLSQIVSVITAQPDAPPFVRLKESSPRSVNLYEVLEIEFELFDADYANPYDPDEIDVRAVLTSPTGKSWNIFGFYDDFQNVGQWKIRFAANETGEWTCVVSATDRDGTGSSDTFQFQVLPSDNHGWIKVSERNPRYFEHDDGAPFYGVGVYYPWRVEENWLDLLARNGANMWGYWNISYDDGTVIESLSSGLGRYDQKKCGRIDQLLQWSAERNMKMMLAIWPHDLLSNTVWAHQWHNNPYKTIVDVKDFYGDETAWKYQEKQYRYLIARWGCYRSLGLWEIVNEINGTDGWVYGNQQAATDWVKKVHDFFRENDPYRHPTTASQSGGKFWTAGYRNVDVANVHLYETSWQNFYPANPLRASLAVYRLVSQDFLNRLSQPGFMGEAGYTNTFGNFAVPSPEYTALYHNALWTTWANGNAATPMWWDFTRRDIISDDVLAQMKAFANVAGEIDYSRTPLERKLITASGCDAFAMVGDSLGFGWVREFNGENVGGKEIRISGIADTSFSVQLWNTWTGTPMDTVYAAARQGVLTFVLPEMEPAQADVAFILRIVDGALTGIRRNEEPEIPSAFALRQNFPNPFNPETTIGYQLPVDSHVDLAVYNANGQLIKRLVNGQQTAGQYFVQWYAAGQATGLYFFQLKANGHVFVRKALLIQ